MRGFVDTVSFIHKPANKEAVIKSLVKNLRLKSAQDAEIGYGALQWLYNLDIRPTIPGHPKHGALPRAHQSESEVSQKRRCRR